MKLSKAEPHFNSHDYVKPLGILDSILLERDLVRADFHRRMFDQDFSMLFRSVHRSNEIKLFDVISNDTELVSRLLRSVSSSYRSSPVDVSIRQLVEEIAQSLIQVGKAFYFFYEDVENNELVISSFSSFGVFRILGTLIQWLPKRTRSHWDREDEKYPREIRILDRDKVMSFKMPDGLGGILSRQNKVLTDLDRYHSLEMNFYVQPSYENPNPTSHFSAEVWTKTQEYVLFRATRETGWNARKSGTTKYTDFFICHRLIRFRRNQVILRDYILNQLGSELTRVGRAYKSDFSVEVIANRNLPSVAELNELETKLSREEVGFSQIFDYCFER